MIMLKQTKSCSDQDLITSAAKPLVQAVAFLNKKILIRVGIRSVFFLFLHENICCGYSLEVPWRGASNEYPQHMFLWTNKKNIKYFWIEKSALTIISVKYALGTHQKCYGEAFYNEYPQHMSLFRNKKNIMLLFCCC